MHILISWRVGIVVVANPKSFVLPDQRDHAALNTHMHAKLQNLRDLTFVCLKI